MKRMTADQLRATALAMGAEAVIGGRPFNSARAVVQPQAKPPAPPLAAAAALPLPPAPPAPETFTRAQVEQMLAEQETRLTERMAGMLANLARPAPAAAEPEDEYHAAALVPEYGPDGMIKRIDIDWQRLQ